MIAPADGRRFAAFYPRCIPSSPRDRIESHRQCAGGMEQHGRGRLDHGDTGHRAARVGGVERASMAEHHGMEQHGRGGFGDSGMEQRGQSTTERQGERPPWRFATLTTLVKSSGPCRCDDQMQYRSFIRELFSLLSGGELQPTTAERAAPLRKNASTRHRRWIAVRSDRRCRKNAERATAPHVMGWLGEHGSTRFGEGRCHTAWVRASGVQARLARSAVWSGDGRRAAPTGTLATNREVFF